MPPDIVVIKHTVIALLLGWALGYERFFRGRASGTQVYCLVSTASSVTSTICSAISVPPPPGSPSRVRLGRESVS